METIINPFGLKTAQEVTVHKTPGKAHQTYSLNCTPNESIINNKQMGLDVF